MGIAPKIAPEAMETIKEVAGVAKHAAKKVGHVARRTTERVADAQEIISHQDEKGG